LNLASALCLPLVGPLRLAHPTCPPLVGPLRLDRRAAQPHQRNRERAPPPEGALVGTEVTATAMKSP